MATHPNAKRPFNVACDEPTREGLDKQAAAMGDITANSWAALILSAIAPLTPAQVLKLMGKCQELKKNPKLRISDI